MMILTSFQKRLNEFFDATRTSQLVMVLAPRRSGTSSGLAALAGSSSGAVRVCCYSRYAAQRFRMRILPESNVQCVLPCELSLCSNNVPMCVDCVPHSMLPAVLVDSRHLSLFVVLCADFTPKEAVRAPAFLGTLKQIITVRCLVRDPLAHMPMNATVRSFALDTWTAAAARPMPCYNYCLKIETAFQFGDPAIDTVDIVVQSVRHQLGTNALNVELEGEICFAQDTVFIDDAEQVAQILTALVPPI